MKRILIIGTGSVLVVALLAGAVFLGASLAGSDSDQGAASAAVQGDDTPPRRGAPARVMELVRDDGSGPVSVRITVEPSPNLPDRESDASGVFVSREDDSIMVGTGGIELDVNVERTQAGSLEPTVTLSHNGPVVEVVVTNGTAIYKEETEMPSPSKSGDQTVQQVVRPVDSLDELGKNTELQVWGRQSGDRVVADILVYRIVSVDLPF